MAKLFSQQSLGLWKDTDRSFVDDSENTLTLTEERKGAQASKDVLDKPAKKSPEDKDRKSRRHSPPPLKGGHVSGDTDDTFSENVAGSSCGDDIREVESPNSISFAEG